MLEQLLNVYPQFTPEILKYDYLWEQCNVPRKAILLEEGKVSNTLYFIVEGATRVSSNYDGKEITVQFFFENSFVASIESYLSNTPSIFSIETIEDCKLLMIKKKNWKILLAEFPLLKEHQFNIITERLTSYINHLLKHIQLKPEERYRDLINNNPQIIKRVPVQQLCSYLGITLVSLSRIRSRIRARV